MMGRGKTLVGKRARRKKELALVLVKVMTVATIAFNSIAGIDADGQYEAEEFKSDSTHI